MGSADVVFDRYTSALGFIGGKADDLPLIGVTPLPLLTCIFHRGIILLITAWSPLVEREGLDEPR